ncbi:mitochondrial carrier domain-containing protein [Lactarius akahatsu]|uniref:Mitochondrial carrier domain-containing protein n=1 Tax=Lactarius akahatsu TaxID=416441 RepID=A0AAD4L6H2_9AGAM|nr:mitochondrial carrier domain-containing protein [Lactarius akahatsu]
MSTPNPFSQPSFFPTHAIVRHHNSCNSWSPSLRFQDHAFAGIGAGTVAVLCMNPLDLLKVKFQVSTRGPKDGIGRGIWRALRDIHANEGWRGLYRGLSPNVAGNASSWGLYFLFYNQLKRRATVDAPDRSLSASQYLLFSAEASAVTAILTNPIWVVKVRTFTAPPNSPAAHRGLWSGLRAIFRDEGWGGLYRGMSLALVGVSNGALQFMTYEKMKNWAFERKRRRVAKLGRTWTTDDDKLSNTAYTIMSGTSKLGALCATYPYQVIRSRIQDDSALARTHHRTITSTIVHTWTHEGLTGFYRGLATNLVRVLPGTCVTFVVYENIAWLLKRAAARREARRFIDGA